MPQTYVVLPEGSAIGSPDANQAADLARAKAASDGGTYWVCAVLERFAPETPIERL